MPRRTLQLLLSVALACLAISGCARREADTAAAPRVVAPQPSPPAPAPAPPAQSAAAEATRGEDLATADKPAGADSSRHAHEHSHAGHDAAGHDACCQDLSAPAGTPVFAPPPKVTKLREGNHTARQVAITFDGAPVSGSTTLLLALLRAYEVKATFFIVADRLEGHRREVDAILAEKHLVGNGTVSGRPLAGLSKQQIAAQVKPCDDRLEHIVGQLLSAAHRQMRLLRPPDGRSSEALAQVAESLGYTVVLWSVDGAPKKGESGDELAKRVCAQVENGSIIRLKDGEAATRKALPKILEYLDSKGFECVTVDEMLE